MELSCYIFKDAIEFRINEKSAVVFKAIYEFVGNYYRVKTQ